MKRAFDAVDPSIIGLVGALAIAIASVVAAVIAHRLDERRESRREEHEVARTTAHVREAIDAATTAVEGRPDVDPTDHALLGAILELSRANERCEREGLRRQRRILQLEAEVERLRGELDRMRTTQ